MAERADVVYHRRNWAAAPPPARSHDGAATRRSEAGASRLRAAPILPGQMATTLRGLPLLLRPCGNRHKLPARTERCDLVLSFEIRGRHGASQAPCIRGHFESEPYSVHKQGLVGWGSRIRSLASRITAARLNFEGIPPISNESGHQRLSVRLAESIPDAEVRILRPSQQVRLQRLTGAARCSSITDRRDSAHRPQSLTARPIAFLSRDYPHSGS
jgi:hypothetical protein